MIIGSGLVARAFFPYFARSSSVCVYAAGVSNSACADASEFNRELIRLNDALDRHGNAELFLYFGTCSVNDHHAASSPYVLHKIRMEQIVEEHPRHLILRLPQLVGNSPNPHTLLNYLFARIARSEKFQVWKLARRNIIDVDDVARIGVSLVLDESARGECINVANISDIAMPDVVEIMERVVGKRSLCEVLDRGGGYLIDIERIRPAIKRCGISFDQGYIERVIRKYYGNTLFAWGK